MVRWITYSIHKTDSLEELNDKVIEELRLEKNDVTRARSIGACVSYIIGSLFNSAKTYTRHVVMLTTPRN